MPGVRGKVFEAALESLMAAVESFAGFLPGH